MKTRLLYILVLAGAILLGSTSINQVSSQTQKSSTYQKHDTTKMKQGNKSMMKDSTHHKKMMKDTAHMKKTNKGGNMEK